MVKVMYGCCVGDWDKFQRYVTRPAPHRQFVALSGQTSIAVTYNRILDCARLAAVDMLVLQHDDLEFIDPNAEKKLLAALQLPDVALVGVAGGGAAAGLAWWNVNPIGHQQINSTLLDFGNRREGDVDLIEGSVMAFSSWAIENLRFDEVPGFHGYDEIAMKAHSLGARVYVANITTFHHTNLGFKSVESEQEWQQAQERFHRKWVLSEEN